jgi:hypothetical protein
MTYDPSITHDTTTLYKKMVELGWWKEREVPPREENKIRITFECTCGFVGIAKYRDDMENLGCLEVNSGGDDDFDWILFTCPQCNTTERIYP